MWINWVLRPLKLVDGDGGKPMHYRLFLDGGWGVGEFAAWITQNILYLPVVIPIAYAAELLSLVEDPAAWLGPIQHAWAAAVSSLFDKVSPFEVLGLTLLAAAAAIVLRSKAETAGQSAPAMVRALYQRLGAAAAMSVVIVLLLYNPAGTLLDVLTVWERLLGGIVGGDPHAPGGPDGVHSASMTQFLRPLTWLLTYGSTLDPECGKAWSKMIEKGGELTCLSPEQVQASHSVGIAFVMTLFALGPAVVYVRFALVAVITTLVHVGVAVVRLSAAGLMAAVSVWQDRPMDEFLKSLFSAAANLAVASGVVGAVVLGPRLAMAAAGSVTASPLVRLIVLVPLYYLLTLGIWWLEKRHGPIRDWLLSNAGKQDGFGSSALWKLAFPGGLQRSTTFMDRVLASASTSGSRWVEQARERVGSMVGAKGSEERRSTSIHTGGSPGMSPESPESAAALGVVNTIGPRSVEQGSRVGSSAREKIDRVLSWIGIGPTPGETLPPRHVPADGETDPRGNDSTAPSPGARAEPETTRVKTIGEREASRHAAPTGAGVAFGPSATIASWRRRLATDAAELLAAAVPELMSLVAIRTTDRAATGLGAEDQRAAFAMRADPRAALAARVAQIAYAEKLLLALGWSGDFDASAALPPAASFFASGLDETGSWTTQYYGD